MSVYGARVFTYRKLVFPLKSDNIGFPDQQHGPYYGQTGAVQKGFWGERMESAFIQEGHHCGFDEIIPMMGVGHFIAAKLKGFPV